MLLVYCYYLHIDISRELIAVTGLLLLLAYGACLLLLQGSLFFNC